MTYINPLSGSILGSAQSQRVQAEQKDRHVRRAQDLEKNVAVQDEELEHQVESSEEIKAVREERDSDHLQSRNKSSQDNSEDQEQPHVDLTA